MNLGAPDPRLGWRPSGPMGCWADGGTRADRSDAPSSTCGGEHLAGVRNHIQGVMPGTSPQTLSQSSERASCWEEECPSRSMRL